PYRLTGDQVDSLTTPGPLLGAFDDASWQSTELHLVTGDSLVLYTDGVTDTRSGTARFGVERLAAVLATTTGAEPDEVASRVDEALTDFEEGPQRDDIAMLVLRVSADPVTGPALIAPATALDAD
ncbi:MAG: phosphoserine phosphatase RsbU/P, partial [Solirubrobacteraceae bacterium]|nr:phosphoserine phosphatase RsbU/P [Solirubrobacteraceae bacterium]